MVSAKCSRSCAIPFTLISLNSWSLSIDEKVSPLREPLENEPVSDSISIR